MGTQWILLMCGFISLAEGSKIDISTTPTEFIESMTGVLTLRCSLSDTQVTGSQSGSLIGRRDVSQTAQDVKTVTSLVIMKDGSDVASVTIASPAISYSNATNVKVTGDLVTVSQNEIGYIELSWSYPSSSQAGEYSCEANAISNKGHNLVFSTTVEVGSRQPTVADLVSHIRDIEVKLDNVEKTVEELKHSEVGTIICGGSYSNLYPLTEHIQGLSGSRLREYKLIDVTFKKPYDHIPNVKVGVEEYVEYDGHPIIRFGVFVTKVTKSGFTLKCSTWTDAQVWKLDVSWISVPQIS